MYTKWILISYFNKWCHSQGWTDLEMPHPPAWRRLQLWFCGGSVNPRCCPGTALIPSFYWKRGEMLCLQRNLPFALYIHSAPVSITLAVSLIKCWHSCTTFLVSCFPNFFKKISFFTFSILSHTFLFCKFFKMPCETGESCTSPYIHSCWVRWFFLPAPQPFHRYSS